MMNIACIGDSLTECRDLPPAEKWPALLASRLGIRTANFGIGGDTTGGMLGRFRLELAKDAFTHCCVMGGVNDIWFGLDWKPLIANLYGMIKQCRFLAIDPIIGIPPSIILPDPDHDPYALFPPVDGYRRFLERIGEYRHQLLRLCLAEGLPAADIYQAVLGDFDSPDPALFLEDGLHLNAAGCQAAADCLIETLGQR